MSNEKQNEKPDTKPEKKIKVKVIGPGSIVYGPSTFANPGSECELTEDEFESVKHLVQKI